MKREWHFQANGTSRDTCLSLRARWLSQNWYALLVILDAAAVALCTVSEGGCLLPSSELGGVPLASPTGWGVCFQCLNLFVLRHGLVGSEQLGLPETYLHKEECVRQRCGEYVGYILVYAVPGDAVID